MNWLRRLLHQSRSEKDLDKELRFHLAQQIADNLAAGLNPKEARRRAQLEFGGIERVKEEVRDSRWETHLENLARDFHYAVRTLRKDWRFSLVAIFALALGIGASTIVFSVAYNVFFHALPYKNYDRSVVVRMNDLGNVGRDSGRKYFFPEEVRAFREQNHVFEEIITFARMRPTYNDGQSVRFFPFGATVSTNAFDYLGVSPLLGRTFTGEDGKSSSPPVFVMNYRFWQQEFGGDPKILNSIFDLNGQPTTLIGIMPPQFDAFGANFWLPRVGLDKSSGAVIGRLKNGITARMAETELNAIAHRMHRPDPGGIFAVANFAIEAKPLLDSLIGTFKDRLYVLLAAVLLLLLIACSNVANLLLARATAREREMAMRATLGATRGRLIRQLVVESFVLAVTASVLGTGLAYFGLKIVVALIPAGTLPPETEIRMNAPILFLALGLSILTTILCSLAPALHVARGDVQPRLASTAGKGAGAGFRHGKLRAALVVSEVALSIVLLVSVGLLVRSFLVLTHVDLGFNPRNVLFFELNLPPGYSTNLPGSLQKKNTLTRQLLDRMSSLPGVTSVAEMSQAPPLQYEVSNTVIPGKPHAAPWETRFELCSEGYFQTLGLPLLRGRFFSEDDVAAMRNVMVVNEAFAHRYFANEDPLGRKAKFEYFETPGISSAAPHNTYFEIIGIVRNSKTRAYDNPSWQSFPQAFLPYSVAGFNWRIFMARTSGDPRLLLKNMGEEVRALDPGVRISTSGTLEDSLKEFYRGPQFELAVLSAFAFIGMALVVIGIFSVMAYTVSLLTHEIGVRVALGAQRKNILSLVLGNGLRLVVVGILAGLVASLAITRFLSSQIPGVSPSDPWTFAAVATAALLVGAAACAIPARRAAAVDPMVALRCE